MGYGAVAGVFRRLGTLIFRGEEIAAPIMKRVSNKQISIFDAAKEVNTGIKNYALKDTNKILPTNPWPGLKTYWNKYHGTENFSWKELWKAGKLGQWLIPAGIILPEIGNVYRAYTDEEGGILTGTAEAGKTTARVCGATVGSILGSLIPVPFLGPILGYMGGDWITGRIVGKTFTENSTEAKAMAANTENAQNQALAQQGTPDAQQSNQQQALDPTANQYAQTQVPQYNYNYNQSYNGLNSGLYPGLNTFNNYSDDFMTQSIFGNPAQQTSAINPFNNIQTPSFQGSQLGRIV